jgi:hypothetical protein
MCPQGFLVGIKRQLRFIVQNTRQQESITRIVENPARRPNLKKAAEMLQLAKQQAPGADWK